MSLVRSRRAWWVPTLLLATTAWGASAPSLLSYQGMVRNSGTPMSGSHDMVFRLFAVETGGSAILLDSHTTGSGGQVTIASGTFHVLLGGGVVTDGPAAGTYASLDQVFRDFGDVFIETEVDGEVLSPRVRIASVGYALNARTLDGLGASSFLPSGTNGAFALRTVRQGATLIWENVSSIRIKPGTLGFPDGAIRQATADLVWSFGNSAGLLGLDLGSESVNTWYYLYAVPDPGDNSMYTAVASVAGPTQSGGAGPTGYPVARFLGSFKNDGSSNVLSFTRTSGMVYWDGNVAAWRSSSGAESPVNTWVAVDASSFQPLTSRAVLSNNGQDCWSTTAVGYLVAAGAPGVSAYSQPLTSDWGDGICQNEMVIGTVNRVFSWYAFVYGGWINGSTQNRNFSYRGYAEDLSDF